MANKHTVIEDLRRRLDQSETDRRQALDRLAAAQERITALLTSCSLLRVCDQPLKVRQYDERQ